MNDMYQLEFEAFEPMPLTIEMVSHCGYCMRVQGEPFSRTPIHCTKFSGSFSPILVNLAACMTCGEYKKNS